jgi:recombination protein RecT
MSKDTTKDLAVQPKAGFIEKFQSNPEIKKALVGFLQTEKKIVRFVSSMRMCFATNPKLKNCTPESLRTVFLNCAEWGLYPSAVTGECYVIPYKDEATFQLGYQGMIALAYRAGVKHIDAQIVYKNDLFEYEYGLNQSLKHVPDKFSSDRGEPVGAYAVATLDSGIQKFEILSKEDILKHRAKSQSYKSGPKYSPWNPDNDPQLIMWRKTLIKQLFKMLPKTPDINHALTADTKGDIIDITPDSDKPTDTDITAFTIDAHAHLESQGIVDKSQRIAMIDEAVKEVAGTYSLDGITTDQLDAVKKLIFTGEAPSEGEAQGTLNV